MPISIVSVTPKDIADVIPVGVAFTQLFVAAGGTGPYDWTVGAGPLPSIIPEGVEWYTGLPTGMTLDNVTVKGTFAGTPTVPGVYAFTIIATDAAANVGYAEFILDVRRSVDGMYSTTVATGKSLVRNVNGELTIYAGGATVLVPEHEYQYLKRDGVVA